MFYIFLLVLLFRLPQLVSGLNGYWSLRTKTKARTFLRHFKVQIKENVIIFLTNFKFDLVWFAKTGQFLHDIRADCLKYGREPLMLGVSDLSFKL